jgi:hypothetical protein
VWERVESLPCKIDNEGPESFSLGLSSLPVLIPDPSIMALDVLQLLASMEQLLFALLVLSSSPVTY